MLSDILMVLLWMYIEHLTRRLHMYVSSWFMYWYCCVFHAISPVCRVYCRLMILYAKHFSHTSIHPGRFLDHFQILSLSPVCVSHFGILVLLGTSWHEIAHAILGRQVLIFWEPFPLSEVAIPDLSAIPRSLLADINFESSSSVYKDFRYSDRLVT